MLVKKVKRPFNFMIKRFDSCAKLSQIQDMFSMYQFETNGSLNFLPLVCLLVRN